jgi:hypothetical protein
VLCFALWLQSSFCYTPLEQAALAFLPAAQTRAEMRETVWLLLGMALAAGAATAAASAALPSCFPGAFTRDAALWPLMRSVTPQAWPTAPMHGASACARDPPGCWRGPRACCT